MTRQEVETLISNCSSWQLSRIVHNDGTIEIKQLIPKYWSKEETQEVDTILETIANSGHATYNEELGVTTVILEDCEMWWWW